MNSVQRSVLDKVHCLQRKIEEERNEVAQLRGSLAETEADITRLHRSLHAISDDLAQLDYQRELDRYLETMISKLIQYGRAIRLAVCCVDPPCPHRASSEAVHRGHQHAPRRETITIVTYVALKFEAKLAFISVK